MFLDIHLICSQIYFIRVMRYRSSDVSNCMYNEDGSIWKYQENYKYDSNRCVRKQTFRNVYPIKRK